MQDFLGTLAVTLATVWSFILQTLFVSYKELSEKKRERLNNNKKFLFSLAFLFLQSLNTSGKKVLGTLLELEFLVGRKEGGGGGEEVSVQMHFCDSNKCERKILNACNSEVLGIKEHQHLKTP